MDGHPSQHLPDGEGPSEEPINDLSDLSHRMDTALYRQLTSTLSHEALLWLQGSDVTWLQT